MIEHDYMTWTLDGLDIAQFKEHLDDFNEVLNTEDGRIYELKKQSLKQYLKLKKQTTNERV